MTDKTHPIPPEKFSGKNLSDVPLHLECAGYGVYEWTPERDGQGKPEAIMLVFHMGGALDGAEIAVRIKSRAEANRMIEVLKHHRDSVWPSR